MKKLTIKVITMMVVIVCIISAMAVPASAQNYDYSDWIYTAETNTTGKTIASFSGIWSSTESNRYMSIYSYCEGGPVDSFSTSMTISIRVKNGTRYTPVDSLMYSTEENGGRTFEGALNRTGADCFTEGRGIVFQMCTSLTDSEDNWNMQYVHDWDSLYGGWKELEL
jgi:hypothetical protein